jgi:hypothetical protein
MFRLFRLLPKLFHGAKVTRGSFRMKFRVFRVLRKLSSGFDPCPQIHPCMHSARGLVQVFKVLRKLSKDEYYSAARRICLGCSGFCPNFLTRQKVSRWTFSQGGGGWLLSACSGFCTKIFSLGKKRDTWWSQAVSGCSGFCPNFLTRQKKVRGIFKLFRPAFKVFRHLHKLSHKARKRYEADGMRT